MLFDPILGHALGLKDLLPRHVSSDPFHVVITADDCEPHVRLHVVLGNRPSRYMAAN